MKQSAEYWHGVYLKRRERMKAWAKARYYEKYADYAAKRSTPLAKYQRQARRAKARGIEFLFSFTEWLLWWGTDLDKRGRKPDSLVMGRKGDIGPYSPENCYKTTYAENAAYALNRRIA